MRNTTIPAGLAALALCAAALGCGSKTPAGSDAGGTNPDLRAAGVDMAASWPDLGHVNFSDIETQVFVAHCGSGPRMGRTCHLKSPAEGTLDLTLGNAYAKLVNVPAYISPTKKRVVPGDPDNSFLWQKLMDRLTPTEGNPMPFQTDGAACEPVPGPMCANPLSHDLLAMVRQWIAEGAPND